MKQLKEMRWIALFSIYSLIYIQIYVNFSYIYVVEFIISGTGSQILTSGNWNNVFKYIPTM